MTREELIEKINNSDSGKSMNKAYEFGKHKGVGVYWNKDTDTVELPRAVFEYILSQVPTEEQEPSDAITLTKEAYSQLCLEASKWNELQMCEDAISREAVLETEYQIKDINGVEYVMLSEVQMKIRKMPSVQPSRKGHWIDVKEQMPEPLQSVIVTWKNHDPEPYYSDIKHKPFVGVAIYYRDKWWWWSAYTEDMLAEYGRSNADEVDDAIEITAWMPLPKPCGAEMESEE